MRSNLINQDVYKTSGCDQCPHPPLLLLLFPFVTPAPDMSSLEKGTVTSGGHRIVEVDQHGHVVDGNINSALPAPTVGSFLTGNIRLRLTGLPTVAS